MSKKGFNSTRSSVGININQLAKIAGCSYQMARKYALGTALPEIPTMLKIATWLDTTINNLLEDANVATPIIRSLSQSTTIEIELELLNYILNKGIPLFALTKDYKNIVNFIVDTVYDATHLAVDTETKYKIIDMMISSAILLNKANQMDEKYACIESN